MKTKDTVSIAATVVIVVAYVWTCYRVDRWHKFQYQDFSTKIQDIADAKKVPPVPVHEYAEEPVDQAFEYAYEDEKPPAFKLNIKGIGDSA
jgi:hypothetical protein